MRILLVDDRRNDVRLFELGLEGLEGAPELDVAVSGPTALQRARAHRPDLVILDLGEPLLGGASMVREMRADPALRDVPVVAFSESCDRHAWMFAYDVGVDSFVAKPCDLDGYVAAVRGIATFWGAPRL